MLSYVGPDVNTLAVVVIQSILTKRMWYWRMIRETGGGRAAGTEKEGLDLPSKHPSDPQ
jgi:hypothetical protein